MPDQLPRYTASAGVSVGPEIDTADIYNGYQKIFNDIDEVAKPIATNLADQQSKAQGEIAGENPGFQSGPVIGRESAIYNNAALASNKSTITANAISSINSMKQRAMGINPDGSSVLDSNGHPVGLTSQSIQQFNDDLKTHGAAMLETVPNENRGYLKNFLSAKATTASASLLSTYNRKVVNQQHLNLLDNNQTIMNEAKQNVINGNHKLAIANVASQNRNLDSYGLTVHMTPEAIEKQKNDNLKSIWTTSWLHNFNTALSQSPEAAQKIHQQLLTSPDAENKLGTSGVKSVSNQMKSILYAREQSLGIDQQKYNMQLKSYYSNAWNNGDDDANTQNQLHQFNTIKGHPDRNDIIDKTHDLYKEYGSLVKEAKSAPLSSDPNNPSSIKSISDIQDELAKNSTNLDHKNPMSVVESGLIKKAQDQITSINSQRLHNPYPLIQQSAGYQNIQQKIKQDPVNNTEKDLLDYANNYQANEKIPQSKRVFVSKQNATDWVGAFKSADMPTKVNMLNDVFSRYGKYGGTVLRNYQDMGKLDANLSLVHECANNPNTKDSAQGLLQSMLLPNKYFESSLVTGPQASSNIMGDSSSSYITYSDFADAMHSQGLYSPQTINYLNTASRYMRYLNVTKNDSKSLQHSQEAVFGSHVDIPTFQGGKYIIMKTDSLGHPVNSDNVKAAIHYMASKAVDGNNLNVPKGNDKLSYRTHLSASIHAINNGNEGWSIVDGSGKTVSFSDIGESNIKYEDAEDGSDLMKSVANDVKKKFGAYNQTTLKKYINSDINKIKQPFKISDSPVNQLFKYFTGAI